MADVDNVKETKEFYLDIPAKNQAFFLKGAGALDWGMQNRLAQKPGRWQRFVHYVWGRSGRR
jgi:hypothetical protein